MALQNFKATEQDIEFIRHYEQIKTARPFSSLAELNVHYKEDVHILLKQLAHVTLAGNVEDFFHFIGEAHMLIGEAGQDNAQVGTLVVNCYKYYILQEENPDCLNDLGAMYYSGDLIEQNYETAAELYALGAELGCIQAAINLGYIYEYGRTGKRDYKKAFQQYAYAAAISSHPEALYKLGDMYAAGHFVEQNPMKATRLWRRSYNESEDIEFDAQAAFRLAKQIADTIPPIIFDNDARDAKQDAQQNKEQDKDASTDTTSAREECFPHPSRGDLLEALHLLSVAEIGLRISIDKGMSYYQNRLRQTIELQERVRDELDGFSYIR